MVVGSGAIAIGAAWSCVISLEEAFDVCIYYERLLLRSLLLLLWAMDLSLWIFCLRKMIEIDG